MPLLDRRHLTIDIGTPPSGVLISHLLVGESFREALKEGND